MKKQKFHCLNCGFDFVLDLYEKKEAEEVHHKGISTGKPHCPKCNRTDLRKER